MRVSKMRRITSPPAVAAMIPGPPLPQATPVEQNETTTWLTVLSVEPVHSGKAQALVSEATRWGTRLTVGNWGPAENARRHEGATSHELALKTESIAQWDHITPADEGDGNVFQLRHRLCSIHHTSAKLESYAITELNHCALDSVQPSAALQQPNCPPGQRAPTNTQSAAKLQEPRPTNSTKVLPGSRERMAGVVEGTQCSNCPTHEINENDRQVQASTPERIAR